MEYLIALFSCVDRFRVCVENIHGVSDSGPPSDPVILKQPTLDIDYDKFGETK